MMNLNKTVVELEINGESYIATLDIKAIMHYKKVNKKPFLKSIQKIEDLDDVEILRMLGSIIRKDEKSQPVGMNFFNKFNPMAVIEEFSPVLLQVFGENMPEAEDESEKK